jgi:hypothetical protein
MRDRQRRAPQQIKLWHFRDRFSGRRDLIYEQCINTRSGDRIRCLVYHYDRATPQEFHGKSQRIPTGQPAELRRRLGQGTYRKFLFANDRKFQAGGLCLFLRIGSANECYTVTTPQEFTPERRHGIEVSAQFGTNQSKMCHRMS